jgi:hypothetical protein
LIVYGYTGPSSVLALQASIDDEYFAVPDFPSAYDMMPIRPESSYLAQTTSTTQDFGLFEAPPAYLALAHIFIVGVAVYLGSRLLVYVFDKSTLLVRKALTRHVPSTSRSFGSVGSVSVMIDARGMVSICVVEPVNSSLATEASLARLVQDPVLDNSLARLTLADPVTPSRAMEAGVVFGLILDIDNSIRVSLYELCVRPSTDSEVVGSVTPDAASQHPSGSNTCQAVMLRPPERLPVLVFFDMVGRYLRSLPAVVVPTVLETDSPVAKSKRKPRCGLKQRRRYKRNLLREQQDEVLKDLTPPTV